MLWAFGSNGSGQLGVGHDDDLSSPEAIVTSHWSSPDTRVKQLAAGGNHTLILCNDGKVRATGNNEDGRCGLVGVPKTFRFEEVDLPLDDSGDRIKIVQLSATWSASFLLSSTGAIYTCGSGNSGELGLGSGVVTSFRWQCIPAFSSSDNPVIQIASSMAHTVAILSNGEVYGWGKGRKGQIGQPAEDVSSPRPIKDVEFAATSAVCGKDFTYIVGYPSSGSFSLLGPNGRDRFGLRSYVPSTDIHWEGIAASWGSIFVLRDSGRVVAWGRNDHGQLPVKGFPEVSKLAAGSEHALALTKSGDVLAWGWGEHGNCGQPTENGDVKGRWNFISMSDQAVQVFAGCATSFVETVR